MDRRSEASYCFVSFLLLAGCNSPSDNEVAACVRRKISEQADYSASPPIICDNYIEVLGAKSLDDLIEGKSARVVARVHWKAKKPFMKGSLSASTCFVSIDDLFGWYQVDDITDSKVDVEFEKWASGWKCKK
jgi:hypothetical protein